MVAPTIETNGESRDQLDEDFRNWLKSHLAPSLTHLLWDATLQSIEADIRDDLSVKVVTRFLYKTHTIEAEFEIGRGNLRHAIDDPGVTKIVVIDCIERNVRQAIREIRNREYARRP